MEAVKVSTVKKKSLHAAKKNTNILSPSDPTKEMSLPWKDRINAIIRHDEYKKDAARFLLSCKKELSKFPEEEQDSKWITHFLWDHQNPVAQKWGMPWFIDPFDMDQVELPLLASQDKRAKWGMSLSTPRVVDINGRRGLVLKVDLAERKKDIMVSLKETLTYYREFFQFFYRLPKDVAGGVTSQVVGIKDKRFLNIEVDLAQPQKKILSSLEAIIGNYRRKFHFHNDQKDQRKKSTKADPWEIWDQKYILGKNVNVITKERIGSSENPTYSETGNKERQAVQNALHQAKRMIQQVGKGICHS